MLSFNSPQVDFEGLSDTTVSKSKVSLVIKGDRVAVSEVSLDKVVFEAPRDRIMLGHQITADLYLPMAFKDRIVALDLWPVRIDGNIVVSEIVHPTYVSLMSIRQFLLRKQREGLRDEN